MPARQAVLAGTVAVALAACSATTEDRLPGIPEVLAAEFPDSVRELAASRIEALAGRPDDPWANGDLAALLHAHGRLDVAIPLYMRAEALSGQEFRWSYLLGVTQQDAGENADAIISFRSALAKRAYVPAAIRLSQSLAAEGLFEEAAGSLPGRATSDGDRAGIAYERGRVLLGLGDASQAVSELETAVELAPESGAARYSLGMAYRALGDEERAVRQLAALAEGGSERPPLEDPVLASVQELAADEHHFLNLGRSLEASGKYEEAIRAYQRALGLEPAMAAAHANLVGLLGRAGDLDRAREHYEKALSLNPGIEELHNNWGVLQATTGNPSAAATAFRRALAVNPNSARALANLGTALIALGDHSGAVRRFEQAVANDPGNGPARMNLGVAALEAGHAAKAIEHLEVALAVIEQENEASVRLALGHAYVQAGRLAQAREQFESAMALADRAGSVDLSERVRAAMDLLAAR